ncbi:MAG: heparinase II/III family protein [Planctomycetota bacterium]|nr:heparinase II/III family protein [Planctomycetota bacterium]
MLTAEDNTWYSDPKIDGFYEWLYGAAFSPFYRMISFGDTGPNRAYDPFDPGVHKFSIQAFANLAWCANGRMPSGSLFHYALMDKPLPKPKKPLSRIWPDGCAAFWEDNPSDRSLMGVLWNCKNTRHGGDGHSHKEVNAIHLCAYGEHILRNSGYVGWGNGPLGFSWDYVHNNAVSANTVLIDDKDHSEKKGGGIVAGFTTPQFDYACGDSKDALPNGKHQRNFCFVHPQDGRVGYWVLFDEVKSDKPSSKVNVVLHPNSDDCTPLADKLEYKWKIGPEKQTYSGHDVFVNIFLATSPASVTVKPGLLANMGGEKNCFVGKYLNSTYETDDEGGRNIVTVLFPHDATHPKAKMTRITGSGFSGAKIDLGNSVTDLAIESDVKKAVKYDGVSFVGIAALCRLKDDSNAFYFVRKGRSFDNGAKSRRGFESDVDVSVYVKDKQGRIISPGAEVTFFYPDVTGVLLDGKAVPILASDDGWIRVKVTQGTHCLKFTATK